eukprot:TRINITY_DN4319_c0_g1_i1.p1 TRINITY_DN4319_c0_g1~~TRINITY_DN4319_c0_g1_i1.p1  ORF type:complete len:220 (+),score=27.43 TRINITY_DN4319_c0_g1_i1:134-793(+)
MFLFPFSPAELKKVKKVQFGILSPDEIKRASVSKIEHPETMENGKPKVGGLLDPHMGVIDRHLSCMTCNGNMTDCPGHFGHIELAKPMFHIGFMNTVLKILRCVCYFCSSILISKSSPKFLQAQRIKNPKHRLRAMLNLCKSKTVCGSDEEDKDKDKDKDKKTEEKKPTHGCGNYQPKIMKDGLKLNAEFKQVADESAERKPVLCVDTCLLYTSPSPRD